MSSTSLSRQNMAAPIQSNSYYYPPQVYSNSNKADGYYNYNDQFQGDSFVNNRAQEQHKKEINWKKWLTIGGLAAIGTFLLASVLGRSSTPVPNDVLTSKRPTTTFKDVAGMTDIKDMLNQKILNPINDPSINKKYQKWGIEQPSGFLFAGPGGTGKTYIAECLAGELGTDLYEIKASEVGSAWAHETSKNISKAIDDVICKAEKSDKPVVLFFDELDSIVRKRTSDTKKYEAEEVNTILQKVQNLHKKNIILIGATNCPGMLDKPALRPGRFNTPIIFRLPNLEEREDLFKLSLRNSSKEVVGNFLNNKEALKKVAQAAEGFSNADIKDIVREGLTMACNNGASEIDETYFLKVIENLNLQKEMEKFQSSFT